MFFKDFSIFSFGSQLIQLRWTIWAKLLKGHEWNISIKFVENDPPVYEEMSFKDIQNDTQQAHLLPRWAKMVHILEFGMISILLHIIVYIQQVQTITF